MAFQDHVTVRNLHPGCLVTLLVAISAAVQLAPAQLSTWAVRRRRS